MRSQLRLTGFLGFAAGFMLAYQNSSSTWSARATFWSCHGAVLTETAERFWGWSENSTEVARDQAELSAKAKRGEAVYGETDLSDYLQGVAARNSTNSQLKLNAMPWCVQRALLRQAATDEPRAAANPG